MTIEIEDRTCGPRTVSREEAVNDLVDLYMKWNQADVTQIHMLDLVRAYLGTLSIFCEQHNVPFAFMVTAFKLTLKEYKVP